MSLVKEKDVEQLLAEDHESLDELLQALLTDFHVGDPSATFARLDLFWARLAMHIRAENLHLFRSILNVVHDDAYVPKDKTVEMEMVVEAVKTLKDDHDFFMHELASAVNAMRECLVSKDPLKETRLREEAWRLINGVSERLKSHNKVEEELVYGLPARLLPGKRQTELAAEVRRELENLPPRFSSGK